MILSDSEIKVTIAEISDADTHNADVVFDFYNHKCEELKSVLFIEIETVASKKSIILYCDFIGNYETCSVLHNNKLLIFKFNTAYLIDCITVKIKHFSFSELAGALKVFPMVDGYLIHGELEIIKTDFELNVQWTASGEDILVSPDGDDSCRVFENRIEYFDFLGNRYTLLLDENNRPMRKWKDYGPEDSVFASYILDGEAVKMTGLYEGFDAYVNSSKADSKNFPGCKDQYKIVFEENHVLALVAYGIYEEIVTVSEIIVAPHYRNKGKGTEIIKELLDICRNSFGDTIKQFRAVIFPNNIASQRAFEKAGFHFESAHEDGDVWYYVYDNANNN